MRFVGIVEVKANLSFSGPMGSFTQGKFYLVHVDEGIEALVMGGYLTFTPIEGEGHGRVDHSGPGGVSGSRVGRGTPGREAQAQEAGVEDGEGGAQPA